MSEPTAARDARLAAAEAELAAARAALDERDRALAEALAQQAATAEVLQAISRSADLPAVLDTIAAETVRLAGADDAAVWRRDPDGVRIIAAHGRLIAEHGRQAI